MPKYRSMSPKVDEAAHYIFDDFNKTFFENKLGAVVFRYIYTKSTLQGSFNCNPPSISIGLHQQYFYMYNPDRIDLLQTILHEMVHYWQFQNKTASDKKLMHDSAFMEKMESFGITEKHSGAKKTITGLPKYSENGLFSLHIKENPYLIQCAETIILDTCDIMHASDLSLVKMLW